MSYADEHPGYKLETEEAARNWVVELTQACEDARVMCNIRYPNDEGRTVREQQKAYRMFMVKHGSALGAVMALHRAGLLGDVAYNELRARVINTLAPTIVGG